MSKHSGGHRRNHHPRKSADSSDDGSNDAPDVGFGLSLGDLQSVENAAQSVVNAAPAIAKAAPQVAQALPGIAQALPSTVQNIQTVAAASAAGVQKGQAAKAALPWVGGGALVGYFLMGGPIGMVAGGVGGWLLNKVKGA